MDDTSTDTDLSDAAPRAPRPHASDRGRLHNGDAAEDTEPARRRAGGTEN
jgi:hypothetical protein